MFNRSNEKQQEQLKALLEKHFESACTQTGLDTVTVDVQLGPAMEEEFIVFLTPPVEYDLVREWGKDLARKLKLTEREYGYYINDAEQKYDGMGIQATARSLLSRLGL
jgi:hypothetical protein